MFLARHFGRRVHLISCIALCAASALGLFFAQLFAVIELAICSVFAASAAGSLGALFIPKCLPGELCPTSSRSLTAACMYLSGMVSARVIIATFSLLTDLIGCYALLPLVLMCE